MLSVFLLPTGYRVQHSTTLSVRLLLPRCRMPLRPGGGLWVRSQDGRTRLQAQLRRLVRLRYLAENNPSFEQLCQSAFRADPGHVLHDLLPPIKTVVAYMLYVHVNMTEFYLLQTVWHAKLLLLG